QAWTTPDAVHSEDTLAAILSDMVDCQCCRLHRSRRHILFGEGDPGALLMIIRDSPTEAQELAGRFFRGAEGELLQRMIGAMKLSPQQVYITCLIKCRPSSDAPAAWSSIIESCLPVLIRQIKVIRPRVICTMGEMTTQILTDRREPIETVRGRFFDAHGSRIMPTLDPAYLIDHPTAKGRVWEDLKKIMAYLGITL
ncbi:MAG: uracil-DNA glycosylase, partial [Gammaproteobacteria bacterium]